MIIVVVASPTETPATVQQTALIKDALDYINARMADDEDDEQTKTDGGDDVAVWFLKTFFIFLLVVDGSMNRGKTPFAFY